MTSIFDSELFFLIGVTFGCFFLVSDERAFSLSSLTEEGREA